MTTLPVPFTLTNQSITVIVAGRPHTAQAGSVQFEGLRTACLNEAWDQIPGLLTQTGALQAWLGDGRTVIASNGMGALAITVETEGGTILLDGKPVPGNIQQRVWAMANAGEDPGPLFRFYERLRRNPSFRSVQQLFDFLQHEKMPFESDGTFLAYKGVREDFKDAHSGQFDNSPGAIHEMPRNEISDDPDFACHKGFHVGALGYASGFSTRVVVVRVDPEYVVCVPKDQNAQKMRVCKYEVVGHHTADGEDAPSTLPSTTFNSDVEDDGDEDWADEEGDFDEDESEFEGDEDEGADESLTDEEHTLGALKAAGGPEEPKVDEFDGPDFDATPAKRDITEAIHALKSTVNTGLQEKKARASKTRKFNRLAPAKLMLESLADLRRYAQYLKILGASKLPGGKSKLVARIAQVRRRK